MSITLDYIETNYPLHFAIWNDNINQLQNFLEEKRNLIESKDPRKRTPLMLAVMLGRVNCVKLLLQCGCNVNIENEEGWTVVQEATATGNFELLKVVLANRDIQRSSSRVIGVPNLLLRLSEAQDFYVEMKWEFTSWVPLVSRMCPSDTYKVYKKGSQVRIDTTLLGFDETQWKRGSRSFVFKNSEAGAIMLEIDHDARQVHREVIEGGDRNVSSNYVPSDYVMKARLKSPLVSTYVDTDKISFERDKQGIWGWRSDRTEVINGNECKVFSASNVELITKTRSEHLPESVNQAEVSPVQSFLSFANVENHVEPASSEGESHEVSSDVSLEEYFDESVNLGKKDIGKPKKVSTKVQSFKGHLWLAEKYPLTLQEQVMPIVDLMAISSSHFAKLKDFIQLQMPSGFPVKIEIPLFHVLTARVTFGNIFGLDEKISGVATVHEKCDEKVGEVHTSQEKCDEKMSDVHTSQEKCDKKISGVATVHEKCDEKMSDVHTAQEKCDNSSEKITCVIDDSIFDAPPSYELIDATAMGRRQLPQYNYVDDDDALLQFAIQQSILEASQGAAGPKMDVWEALQSCQQSDSDLSSNSSAGHQPSPVIQHSTAPLTPSLEQRQLQRAIEESLLMSQCASNTALHLSQNTETFGLSNQNFDSKGLANQTFDASRLANQTFDASGLTNENVDTELELAISLSQKEQEEEEKMSRNEEEILKRILELSLNEK